jgi:hypothetical protein
VVKDSEEAMVRCTELEADLAELRAAYELYFQGVDRLPPLKRHDAYKRAYAKLKSTQIRQTAAKFRIETIGQKLLTYERLWDRTIKEIENGSYKRDLAKLKRKEYRPPQKQATADPDFHIDEDLDVSDLDEGAPDLSSALAAAAAPSPKPQPAVPSVAKPQAVPVAAVPAPAPVPVAPPAAVAAKPAAPKLVAAPPQPVAAVNKSVAPRPPAATPDAGLSDTKIKAIYDAYVMAKKRCGEDTRAVTLDSVSSSLKKQVPVLMKAHNAKSVEFKVVIKDGKAVLRALPKE